MRKMLRKLWQGMCTSLRLGVYALALFAAAQLALRLNSVKRWVDQFFMTQQKVAVSLLENQQIAELATRKMKWKVLTLKESMHESLVIETIYTLKFGFDLTELAPDAIQVDHASQTVTIHLPPIRLLSVDTFGDRKQLVGKKTLLARVMKPAYDEGVDEAAEAQQLMHDLREQHLIDATQLAADFQAALAPIWGSQASFALKVVPHTEEVDVEALFTDYQKRK